MEITRTANAGVLLQLDGVSLLLDGVCKAVHTYMGTPDAIRQTLTEQVPDVLAFTHKHLDHYDSIYAAGYEKRTQRPVYGPERPCEIEVGRVKLQSIATRHIGRVDVPHVSFIIAGSKTVWFMGDASPITLKGWKHLPKPDVLIASFAYALTQPAWQTTKEIGAKEIILLHLPDPGRDVCGLWDAVKKTTHQEPALKIPEIGQTLTI